MKNPPPPTEIDPNTNASEGGNILNNAITGTKHKINTFLHNVLQFAEAFSRKGE